MKLMSDFLSNYKNDYPERLIHFVRNEDTKCFELLPEPMLCKEIICRKCGKSEGLSCMRGNGDKRFCWFCNSYVCMPCDATSMPVSTSTQHTLQSHWEWPLFCEYNGLGDVYHDVRFEMIQQSEGKIDYLRKFCMNPSGVIVMYGEKGTGKTYASLGALELFVRRNRSAVFMTHNALKDQWMKSMTDPLSSLKRKIQECILLVIDELSSLSPEFKNFLLDIISHRIQWRNKGTILTTNFLNEDELRQACGDPLFDRLMTGQSFHFTGGSRRKRLPL